MTRSPFLTIYEGVHVALMRNAAPLNYVTVLHVGSQIATTDIGE
jgi:hypothetical protein